MQEKVLKWANGTQHEEDTVTWQMAEIAFNLLYWITAYHLNGFDHQELPREQASCPPGQNLIITTNKTKLFLLSY